MVTVSYILVGRSFGTGLLVIFQNCNTLICQRAQFSQYTRPSMSVSWNVCITPTPNIWTLLCPTIYRYVVIKTKVGKYQTGFVFTTSILRMRSWKKVIFNPMYILFTMVNKKHMVSKTAGSPVLIIINTEHMLITGLSREWKQRVNHCVINISVTHSLLQRIITLPIQDFKKTSKVTCNWSGWSRFGSILFSVIFSRSSWPISHTIHFYKWLSTISCLHVIKAWSHG